MRIEVFAFITLVVAGLITLFTDGDPLHFKEVLPFCRGVPPTAYDLGVTVILLFFVARLLRIARDWWAARGWATPPRTWGLPGVRQSARWHQVQDDPENDAAAPMPGSGISRRSRKDSRISR